MKFNILPKEQKFFIFFNEQAENIAKGAELFASFLENFEDQGKRESIIKEISQCEHEGDELTHKIRNLLSETFITPLDREDIYELSAKLDDILDFIDKASERMIIYKIEKPTKTILEMSQVLVEISKEVKEAVLMLARHRKDLKTKIILVNELENKGDKLYTKALSELFEDLDFDLNGYDLDDSKDLEKAVAVSLLAIKKLKKITQWKDIYQAIERAFDCCEDAANIIENLVIKHG